MVENKITWLPGWDFLKKKNNSNPKELDFKKLDSVKPKFQGAKFLEKELKFNEPVKILKFQRIEFKKVYFE